MSYNSNVPTASSNGASDYSSIQGNFAQIQTSFSIDHEPLAVGGGIEGFHKKSSYVQQSGDPSPAASLGIAYTKASGGHTELFYEGEVTTGKVSQITNQGLSASSGEGMLPGGLQIRSGVANSNGSGISNSFSTAFPNACLSVVLTGSNTSQSANVMKVSSFTASAFVAKSPQGESGYYIATGY